MARDKANFPPGLEHKINNLTVENLNDFYEFVTLSKTAITANMQRIEQYSYREEDMAVPTLLSIDTATNKITNLQLVKNSFEDMIKDPGLYENHTSFINAYNEVLDIFGKDYQNKNIDKIIENQQNFQNQQQGSSGKGRM